MDEDRTNRMIKNEITERKQRDSEKGTNRLDKWRDEKTIMKIQTNEKRKMSTEKEYR